MGRAAFQAMVDKTGEDLRAFAGGLEKLVDYTGQRSEITAADVEAALTRTKKDPLYELQQWVESLDFRCINNEDYENVEFNDDRFGRMLNKLYSLVA